MPRNASPRTEPQSRRDRWDEADPRARPQTAAAPLPDDGGDGADPGGQSGYAAGDGRLDGAGAWSGRAKPTTASPGSGPVPGEGELRTGVVRAPTTPAKKRTTKSRSKRG